MKLYIYTVALSTGLSIKRTPKDVSEIYCKLQVINTGSLKRPQINIYYLNCKMWSSQCGSAVTNLTSIHEDEGSIPGLAQRVKDLALLWLWGRMTSVALMRPLAWEPPYAAGAALKKRQKKMRRFQMRKQIGILGLRSPYLMSWY